MTQFKIAGLCFTDASGVAFQHDFRLVVLSYLVAVAGSFAALEMIDRWRKAKGTAVRCWHLASAAALGGTIWSMHFIAMLSIEIGVPLTYAPGIALLSLLIAIGAVFAGLQIIDGRAPWTRVCLAGIIVGLGVVAMHYIGMAGVRFPGTLAYTPVLWSLSLLVGIAAATVAIWLSFAVRETWQRIVAAVVMGGAICGMHYTGMAAAVFQFDPLARVQPGLPSGPLAAAVALTTLSLVVCALIFVGVDRRLLAAAQREAELFRRSNGQLARANAELVLRRQQFDAVLDNMTQGVCFFDAAGRLLMWNRRYIEIYSLPSGAAYVGCSLDEIVDHRYAVGSIPRMSPSDYLAWRRQIAAVNEPSKTVVTLKNGRIVDIYRQPTSDGGWVATHEDITERTQAEMDVVFMARHDALTRLPNRVLFNERLEQAIDLSARGSGFAVLCLDLDHFKLINDTLGHPIGDGLLRAAANRLQECVRDTDTVARLGGDEFAVIQFGIEQPDDAEFLANRIVAAFRNAFDVDGHQILVGTSVGVAVAPGDGNSCDKLLKSADIALYLAKIEGRGTVRFFESEMDARIHLRRMLELDLRNAIAKNEFEIYYQPLVNLVTSCVTGFEALLRWHHPTRGIVSPIDFIPFAEETGMIVPIGEWVLRSACFEAENWSADITVAVNLSPVQFNKSNLIATVKSALDASGLRANRLQLEITEAVLLQGNAAVLATLHQLRAMGIVVALDDFRTGYSSLSYLRSFPFDKIKIDQSFVQNLNDNKGSTSIIRAITALGHNLGMKTTAEGVETLEQLDQLREEGCTEVQGFIFSHPMPAKDLPLFMERIHRFGIPSIHGDQPVRTS